MKKIAKPVKFAPKAMKKTLWEIGYTNKSGDISHVVIESHEVCWQTDTVTFFNIDKNGSKKLRGVCTGWLYVTDITEEDCDDGDINTSCREDYRAVAKHPKFRSVVSADDLPKDFGVVD